MKKYLINDDCLTAMSKLPTGRIDLVLTDPPYGTTACKWDSVIPFEPMWAQIKRLRKEKAAVVLFGSEPFSSFLRVSNIKEFKYDWIWDKSVAANFMCAKYQPLKEHEILSVFYAKAGQYYPIKQLRSPKSQKRRKSKETGKYTSFVEHMGINKTFDFSKMDKKYRFPRSIQPFNLDTAGGRRDKFHPTQKPVALLEYLIKTYTLPGETVLDFTMGSGSTGVACANTDRNFVGIEKNDKYFAIAKDRINEVINDSTEKTKK